jgi:hypothetical protein
MAIPAAVVWEVRTDGDDGNGGGFYDTAGAGTDRSLQAAAYVTGLNLTVDAVVDTHVTPDGHTADAADLSNVVYIYGGAGFTVGRYVILGVTGAKWILDRSPAALGTSGGDWRMGGALASPGMASGVKVAGNDVFVKSGTYNISSATPQISGGAVLDDTGAADTTQSFWVGYDTTRTRANTDASRPIFLATGGTTYKMFHTTGLCVTVRNIICDTDNRSGVDPFYEAAAFGGTVYINCKAIDGAQGFYATSASLYLACEALDAVIGFDLQHTQSKAVGCWAHDNSGSGFSVANDGAVVRCIANRNGSHGFHEVSTGYASFVNCTSYGNTGSGFYFANGFGRHHVALNCVSVGNTGYGFNFSNAASEASQLLACAHYGNTAGGVNGTAALQDQMATLTGDPFTDAASDDFSLNNVAGQGAALRGASYPLPFTP